ncbi:MAG: putative alkyl/aryl-sulfatase YjcS [Stenotrophomonas maltophilia]|nr:MAG: putative alkyl/aryl-sulfatase YjcS [Stenotrophomonas maltophilia]
MGFYDGNPANLNTLPPQDAGRRYVAAMGGADAVLASAHKAYDAGDYRWVVELLKQLVFAEPDNSAARTLQADAMEQLGYQSENATWRNAYLSGAQELRVGVAEGKSRTNAPDMIRGLTPAMFFDYLAVRIDALKAADEDLLINWRFTDLGQDYALTLRNGVLTHRDGMLHDKPDISVSMTKELLDRIALKQTGFLKEATIGGISIDGGRFKLLRLLGGLDEPNPQFNLVTP